MPSNIIKNIADEKAWKRAKKIAKKQGKPNSWALVVHIFQQIKKNDISFQNNNTTTKSDRRKEIKLLKVEQRKAAATALYNKVVELKSILSKAEDKPKSKYKQWQPTVTPTDPMNRKVKGFIDSGFHPREAEYLAGLRSARLNHGAQDGTEITPLSDAMLTHIKPFIEKHDHILRSSENAATEPAKNPHKNIAHHVNEYAALRAKLYEPAVEKFKNSQGFDSLSFAEKSKALRDFNKEWEANIPNVHPELHELVEQVNNAKIKNPTLRQERVKNIRNAYIRSGGEAGGLQTQEEISDSDMDKFNEIVNERPGEEVSDYGKPTDLTGQKNEHKEQSPEEKRKEKLKSLFESNPSYSDAHAYILGLYSPLINSLVFKYLKGKYPNSVRTRSDAENHVDADIITQDARDGLIRAIRKLDPKKGNQISYIKNSINGAIYKEDKRKFSNEVVPTDYEAAKKDAGKGTESNNQEGVIAGGSSNTKTLADLGANFDDKSSEQGESSGLGIHETPGAYFQRKFGSFIDKKFNKPPEENNTFKGTPTQNRPTVVRRKTKLNEEQEERKSNIDAAKKKEQ